MATPKQYAAAARVLQRMAGYSQVQAQDWLEQAVPAEIQAVLEIDVTPTPAERLQMVLDHHADRRRAESTPQPTPQPEPEAELPPAEAPLREGRRKRSPE